MTFHIWGNPSSGYWFIANPTFEMDLQFWFYVDIYTQKEAEGSTSVGASLCYWKIHTSGIGYGELINGLKKGIDSTFAGPVKISSDTIPAAAQLLSLKTLRDGSLVFYLQPGAGATRRQLALQDKPDELAGP